MLRFVSSPPHELFQILVKKGQYRLSSTWCCSVLWDVVLLLLVLFWINVELKLLNCCLLPLSEQKLFQPRHDVCFFVSTKLCITPFISSWKHMVLACPMSHVPYNYFAVVNLRMPLENWTNATVKTNYIFNECCFKRMSLLIWINATVLEMLLSYFVFHQDKLDASFCRRMFHCPLLASNCFLFSLY